MGHRGFRWLAMVGVAALLGGQGAALAAGPLRVTKAVRATADELAPTRTFGAPYLAIDPRNPRNIVGANVEMRTRTCHLLRSGDAGMTWAVLDSFPSPRSHPWCFHTSGTTTQTPIAFGRDGTLYFGLTGWGPADLAQSDAHGGTSGNMSVLLARSDDLGDTWQQAIARNARGRTGAGVENNRPVTALAVDVKNGNQDIVYLGWNARYPQAQPAPPGRPMVAASTDGGKTFSDPVAAFGDFYADRENADRYGGGSPQLAVADDGTLYAAFFGSGPGGYNAVLVAQSTDNGKTFTATEAAPPSGFFGPMIMTWSAAGGEKGTIHLIYENEVDASGAGDRDIFYQQSTDGGKAFSTPKVLNDDDPSQVGVNPTQVTPNLSVAPNGRVDAVWWDFRDDPGFFVNDVYYSYSTDNGRSWSKNVRVSDLSINRRIGVWSNGFDMRQPVGIASANEYAVFAWDDTRNGDELGQAQDVYAAVVQFAALGPGSSNALRYLIAGLAGLVIAGIVLLVMALRTPAGPRLRPASKDQRVGVR